MGGVPDLVDAQAAYVREGLHAVPARLMAAVIPEHGGVTDCHALSFAGTTIDGRQCLRFKH